MRIVDIEPVIELLQIALEEGTSTPPYGDHPVSAEKVLALINSLPLVEEENNIKKLKEIRECFDKENISLLKSINQLLINNDRLADMIKHYGVKNEKN